MNVQPDVRMGKSEFLTWVQAREERYELAGSSVVMMTGGGRAATRSSCASLPARWRNAWTPAGGRC